MKSLHLSLAVLVLASASARSQSTALDQLRAGAGNPVPASIPTPAAQPLQAAVPTLPDDFTAHEEVLAARRLVGRHVFDLQENGNKFGTVAQTVLDLTKDFTYEDAARRCVAKSHADILSWGTKIEVSDCSGHPIGSIQEHVLRSLVTLKRDTLYSVYDGRGREIATSEKVQVGSTSMTLRKPDGTVIAELRRPWANLLSDNWEVRILDHAAVDPRIIVFIAAHKTAAGR